MNILKQLSKKNGKIINTDYYNFTYKEKEFNTKFNLKSTTKNFRYYNCFKIGKGRKGLVLYDTEKNEFRIYQKCDFTINHEYYSYEKFEHI